MTNASLSIAVAAKRFASVGPSFGLLGVLVTLASLTPIGQISQSAAKAAQEMLALNALALIAIAAMFFTGAVSLVLGRPTPEWNKLRHRVFHYFAARPAEFVADFTAPMFWFFLGVGVVITSSGTLTLLQALLFACFLASLVVFAFVTLLYVYVLHSPGLATGWRLFRTGRLVGAVLLGGSVMLAYLLPVVPAAGR